MDKKVIFGTLENLSESDEYKHYLKPKIKLIKEAFFRVAALMQSSGEDVSSLHHQRALKLAHTSEALQIIRNVIGITDLAGGKKLDNFRVWGRFSDLYAKASTLLVRASGVLDKRHLPVQIGPLEAALFAQGVEAHIKRVTVWLGVTRSSNVTSLCTWLQSGHTVTRLMCTWSLGRILYCQRGLRFVSRGFFTVERAESGKVFEM